MADPILPIVKVVAPYISQIAQVAIPVFTSMKESSKRQDNDAIVAQQIGELQDAASQNTQNIKELADNLEKALVDFERSVQSIDSRLAQIEKRFDTYRIVNAVALTVAATALVVTGVLLLRG